MRRPLLYLLIATVSILPACVTLHPNSVETRVGDYSREYAQEQETERLINEAAVRPKPSGDGSVLFSVLSKSPQTPLNHPVVRPPIEWLPTFEDTPITEQVSPSISISVIDESTVQQLSNKKIKKSHRKQLHVEVNMGTAVTALFENRPAEASSGKLPSASSFDYVYLGFIAVVLALVVGASRKARDKALGVVIAFYVKLLTFRKK